MIVPCSTCQRELFPLYSTQIYLPDESPRTATMPQRVNHSLYWKYSQSLCYTYTKPVNEMIFNRRTPQLILCKDEMTYHQRDEFLHRLYPMHQYQEKLRLFTEFYKYHSDIPRWALEARFISSLDEHYDRKRKLVYFRIQRLIERENQANPDRPPKGLVGEEPAMSDSSTPHDSTPIPQSFRVLDSNIQSLLLRGSVLSLEKAPKSSAGKAPLSSIVKDKYQQMDSDTPINQFEDRAMDRFVSDAPLSPIIRIMDCQEEFKKLKTQYTMEMSSIPEIPIARPINSPRQQQGLVLNHYDLGILKLKLLQQQQSVRKLKTEAEVPLTKQPQKTSVLFTESSKPSTSSLHFTRHKPMELINEKKFSTHQLIKQIQTQQNNPKPKKGKIQFARDNKAVKQRSKQPQQTATRITTSNSRSDRRQCSPTPSSLTGSRSPELRQPRPGKNDSDRFSRLNSQKTIQKLTQQIKGNCLLNKIFKGKKQVTKPIGVSQNPSQNSLFIHTKKQQHKPPLKCTTPEAKQRHIIPDNRPETSRTVHHPSRSKRPAPSPVNRVQSKPTLNVVKRHVTPHGISPPRNSPLLHSPQSINKYQKPQPKKPRVKPLQGPMLTPRPTALAKKFSFKLPQRHSQHIDWSKYALEQVSRNFLNHIH